MRTSKDLLTIYGSDHMGKFDRQVARYLFAKEVRDTVVQYTVES